MSHLSKKKPSPRQILTLDPFDMSFMTVTGNIKFINPVSVIVAKLKAEGATLLWGPEAKLMELALWKSWLENAEPLIDVIEGAFDLDGDISVDEIAITEAFDEYSDIGEWTYKAAREKILQLVAKTQEKALRSFKNQRKKSELDDFLDRYLEAIDLDLAAYMAEYPELYLLEVEKVIRVTELPAGARTVDKLALRERIRQLRTVPRGQFGLTTDIDAGRTWSHTGIMYADQTQATVYQILAERDRITCPVCKKLDGTTYSVKRQMEKVDQFMELAGDVGAIAEMYRFPRIEDVDNRSPEELHNQDYIPPFHGNCRCEVVIVY
jgi:hypothetical protein